MEVEVEVGLHTIPILTGIWVFFDGCWHHTIEEKNPIVYSCQQYGM
jgi:hypothetical protein